MVMKAFDLRMGTEGRFQMAVFAESRRKPRGVVVSVVRTVHDRPAGHSAGFAICSEEDDFDIRVGVPLALRRALRALPGVNRPALTREFFRQWPEAHPGFKLPPKVTKVQPSPKFLRGGRFRKPRFIRLELGDLIYVEGLPSQPFPVGSIEFVCGSLVIRADR